MGIKLISSLPSALETARSDVHGLPKSPPDLLRALQSLLTSRSNVPSTVAESFTLASVASSLGISPSHYYDALEPLQTTSQLLAVYSLLSPPLPPSPASTTLTRAQSAVLRLHQQGWTSSTLTQLTVGVGLVCWEAVRMSQFDPAESWTGGVYDLVRRTDLARQFNGGSGKGTASKVSILLDGVEGDQKNDETIEQSTNAKPRKILSMDAIVERTKAGLSVADPPSTRTEDEEMSTGPKAERFNEDRRLEEIMRMLQYEEPVTITSDRTL